MEIEYELGIWHESESQNNDTFIDVETISDDEIDGCTNARRKLELEDVDQILVPKIEIFENQENSSGNRAESIDRKEKTAKIVNLTEKLRNLEAENEILESECAPKFRDLGALKMHLCVAIQAKFAKKRVDLEETILNFGAQIQEISGKVTKKSNKERRAALNRRLENAREKLELAELDREILGVETRLAEEKEWKMRMEEVLGIPPRDDELVDQTQEGEEEKQGPAKAPMSNDDLILNLMDIDFDPPESRILKTSTRKKIDNSKSQLPPTAPEEPPQRKLRPRKLPADASDAPRHLNPPKSKKAKISISEVLNVEGTRKSQRIQNLTHKSESENSDTKKSRKIGNSKIEDSESPRLQEAPEKRRGRPPKLERLQSRIQKSKIQKSVEKLPPKPTRKFLRNGRNLKFKKDSESQKFEVKASEEFRIVVEDSEFPDVDVNDSEYPQIVVEDFENPGIDVKESDSEFQRHLNPLDYQLRLPKQEIFDSDGIQIPPTNSESDDVEILKTKIFLNLDSESDDDEEIVKVEIESEDEEERIRSEFVQHGPDPIPIVEERDDSLDAYIPREFRILKDSEDVKFSIEDSKAFRMVVVKPECLNVNVEDSGDSEANVAVENFMESESKPIFLFDNPTDPTGITD